MRKSNRIIAGYHLLNMIATAEGELDAKSDEVIREYLAVEALMRLNLDDELDELIQLAESEFDSHFKKKAIEFYDDSNEAEREEFKLFAKDLIRADDEISKEENRHYRMMLHAWRERDQANKS
ncbi:MAG: TerB family tellurite resistance protein [Flavobacteriaceae bacterium]|nr:TerB family tellurite resistance protein [Flavobacteriaceae bacterium]